MLLMTNFSFLCLHVIQQIKGYYNVERDPLDIVLNELVLVLRRYGVKWSAIIFG